MEKLIDFTKMFDLDETKDLTPSAALLIIHLAELQRQLYSGKLVMIHKPLFEIELPKLKN